MDLTIPGLIASMVVFVIIFGMLALIFDVTLRVLDQQRLYTEFYSEAQRLTNIIDMFLTNSVWTNEIAVSKNSITLDYFTPSQSTVIKQSKVLKVENGALIYDGKKITDISLVVKSVRFSLSQIGGKKYIILTIEPKFEKFKVYTVPLLTALSEAS
ncbi:MAG: hypothetical protein ACP5KD_04680 [Fervidobacterium sp.]|jgi:hypothetical protein